MKKFLAIIFLLAGLAAGGQSYPPLGMERGEVAPPQGSVDLDENGNPIEEPEADSMKKVRPKKPLRSYLFDDSIKQNRFFSWRASTSRNAIELVPIDTAIHNSQPHHPFTDHGVAWQGNMGGAVMPLDYTERADYCNFAFAQGFDAYNIFPERAMYYNVKNPLTFFSYYMSGQAKRFEEGFYFTHAQNISPSSGFNVDYRSQGVRGYYNWDKGRDKNLSLAFSHTGRQYTVHGGYIYNTVNNKENGGVVNDRYITDTIFELAEAIPVKLRDARNVIKGNTFYITQSFGAPMRKTADSTSIADYTSFFVGHSFEWSKWGKKYTDTRDETIYNRLLPGGDWDNISPTEFYADWLLDPRATNDSIAETLMSNRIFVQIQPYDREGVIGLIDAGVGADQHKYYMFRPREYLTGRGEWDTQTDYYLYGAVEGKVSRYFDWEAHGHFHTVGDAKGDYAIGGSAELNLFVREREISLRGEAETDLHGPAYWHENMYSNHFAWENSFAAEQQTRLRGVLRVPSWNLEMGAVQSIVDNKIYYDFMALPAQKRGTVNVTGAWVDKLFSLGNWRLRHRILAQRSSDHVVIPVPGLTAYVSYSFEFDVVQNALRARIGLDCYYNTRYNAPGWMPATAQFYNQREKELGGYPLVDAFVSAKWKRMRILLKMEHVNENLLGSRNYFTLLNYPLHKRVFKLGFTWAFYD